MGAGHTGLPLPRVGVTREGGVPSAMGRHREQQFSHPGGGGGKARGRRSPERGSPAPRWGARPQRGQLKSRPDPSQGQLRAVLPFIGFYRLGWEKKKPRGSHPHLPSHYLLLWGKKKKKFSSGARGTRVGWKQSPSACPPRRGWVGGFVFPFSGPVSPPTPPKSQCTAAHAPPALKESRSPWFYRLTPYLDRVISPAQGNPWNDPRVFPQSPFSPHPLPEELRESKLCKAPGLKAESRPKKPKKKKLHSLLQLIRKLQLIARKRRGELLHARLVITPYFFAGRTGNAEGAEKQNEKPSWQPSKHVSIRIAGAEFNFWGPGMPKVPLGAQGRAQPQPSRAAGFGTPQNREKNH